VLSFTSYYMAIAALPLAEAAALAFAAPLFLTGLSALILGEPVGRDRWLAVAVGFVGVLVVLRPGSALFEPAALLAVASAFCYAGSQTITRHLGRTESGATMALASTLMFLFVAVMSRLVIGSHGTGAGLHPSLAFLARDWVWRGWGELALIAAAGLVASVGGYSLVQAYRAAPAGTVAPFEYVMILWAVLWGYLFWGEVPGPFTVAGVALTIAAGLYVAHREARSRRLGYFTRKCARRLRAQQDSSGSAQTGRSLP
jgi:drug/metabolite transporter (DMT)-like permease